MERSSVTPSNGHTKSILDRELITIYPNREKSATAQAAVKAAQAGVPAAQAEVAQDCTDWAKSATRYTFNGGCR